jgi:hypothetical protein
MMFSADRRTHRHIFIDAWSKAQSGQPLEPVEAQIVQVARLHPQFAHYLTDPDGTLDRDFPPESAEGNPFLHMALHIVILEQLSIDQPAGIRRLHQQLVAATGDLHEAEHRIMDCLAEGLWYLQRDNRPFDEAAYLKCVERAGGGIQTRG